MLIDVKLRSTGFARLLAAAIVIVGVFDANGSLAQELTPRAYWPLPNGSNVAGVGYQRTAGDIVVDPSLPITGVDSSNDFLQLTYQRTVAVLGRTASVQVGMPFVNGTTQGIVDGEFLRRNISGLGDARIRFAINLAGAPSMSRPEFAALLQDPRPIVGASFLVQVPTGVYDNDRIINAGTNRWSVKPGIGVILPFAGSWLFEAEVGAWLFGDNKDYLGDTRRQDPVIATEMHLIRVVNRRMWLSLDANYYFGGRTRVGSDRQADLQRNSRVGVTAVVAIKGRHAVRPSFSTGLTTRSGGDYNIFSLAYLYSW